MIMITETYMVQSIPKEAPNTNIVAAMLKKMRTEESRSNEDINYTCDKYNFR